MLSSCKVWVTATVGHCRRLSLWCDHCLSGDVPLCEVAGVVWVHTYVRTCVCIGMWVCPWCGVWVCPVPLGGQSCTPAPTLPLTAIAQLQ